MGFSAHRNGDLRTCGATTIVSGQSKVYVNGKLWAVDGDPNSHGAGNLKPSTSKVYVSGKKVIIHRPDTTYNPDSAGHPVGSTDTAEGSGNVYSN